MTTNTVSNDFNNEDEVIDYQGADSSARAGELTRPWNYPGMGVNFREKCFMLNRGDDDPTKLNVVNIIPLAARQFKEVEVNGTKRRVSIFNKDYVDAVPKMQIVFAFVPEGDEEPVLHILGGGAYSLRAAFYNGKVGGKWHNPAFEVGFIEQLTDHRKKCRVPGGALPPTNAFSFKLGFADKPVVVGSGNKQQKINPLVRGGFKAVQPGLVAKLNELYESEKLDDWVNQFADGEVTLEPTNSAPEYVDTDETDEIPF